MNRCNLIGIHIDFFSLLFLIHFQLLIFLALTRFDERKFIQFVVQSHLRFFAVFQIIVHLYLNAPALLVQLNLERWIERRKDRKKRFEEFFWKPNLTFFVHKDTLELIWSLNLFNRDDLSNALLLKQPQTVYIKNVFETQNKMQSSWSFLIMI